MNFPRDKNQFVLSTAASDGDVATVHKAKYVNPVSGEEVAVGIKIFVINNTDDIYFLTTNLYKARAVDHENISKVHCSFIVDDRLWVVMSPPATPIASIIRSTFPRGLPEKAVGYILNQTLKAMHYMHERNEACGNIGAGVVCLDDECKVKMKMCWYDAAESGYSSESEEGKSMSKDVWKFGRFALELFYGEVPTCDEIESLMGNASASQFRRLRIKASRVLGNTRERNIMPRALAEVVEACLCRDENARPTTTQLTQFRYFQKKISASFSLQNLINKTL